MSLFRLVKYSSLLFFLGKYKNKLFKVVGVLLFALITSLIYQDVVDYLQIQHPGTVVYALVAKIFIVYGSLAFVLWQFRPQQDMKPDTEQEADRASAPAHESELATPPENDRLSELEDVARKETLRSRYDQVLDGQPVKKS